MTDPEAHEWMSTTWQQIEDVVDDRGYRAGFVEVFLEFRGAVLDDMPLDARGRPEVVNQSNFAKHFGIAISTFHRWLTQYGGEEFELAGERKERAEAAKERQKTKATKKDRDALAQHIRRKVPEGREDFVDKAAVHRSDLNMWCIDLSQLLQWEDSPEKAKLAETYLDLLDAEVEALERFREELLAWRTNWDATDGTAAA